MNNPLAVAVYNSNVNRAAHSKRYLTKIAEGQGQAIYQTNFQLGNSGRRVFADKGPYEKALGTSIYDVPDDGSLGDASSPSIWESIGTTFASAIGTGLSARIGGSTNPQPAQPPAVDIDRIVARLKEAAPTPVPAAPAAMPTWAKAALAGAGVLSLLYIIKRA